VVLLCILPSCLLVSQSEAIVFIAAFVILVLRLHHVDQPVVRLHRVLHVQVLCRRVLLPQHGLHHVLEHCPAVLHIEVDLARESVRLDVHEADDVMGLA